MKVALSYIITTYNKLSYLKVTLPHLLAACLADEEIVIVDGGSTDGTKEYLQDLSDQKKIHAFISEIDYGEAHGINKAILLSRGDIIKIITDDDVFDYNVIHHCRLFMQKNRLCDILGFDGLGCRIIERTEFQKSNYLSGFLQWQKDQTPFVFCGLSFMIRRSSISYLGIFSTAYKIIDMEYSIRVSSLKKCNIAFYTGIGFVNLVNPDSNSEKFYSAVRIEQKKLSKIYPSIRNNFKLNEPLLLLKEKFKQIRQATPLTHTDPLKILELYKIVVEKSLSELTRNTIVNEKILTLHEVS
jgi:glycosyltransferase involved in cell wall biosynthesis